MACRLPGNNNSPEELWQSILDKKVASGPLPKVRWQAYHQRHPHNTKVSRVTLREQRSTADE
jgi:6-methylsalicylic acid synthase